MEDDKVICNCMDIYKSEIVAAIKEHGLTTFEEVGEHTDAGTACGTCEEDILEILEEVNGKK